MERRSHLAAVRDSQRRSEETTANYDTARVRQGSRVVASITINIGVCWESTDRPPSGAATAKRPFTKCKAEIGANVPPAST